MSKAPFLVREVGFLVDRDNEMNEDMKKRLRPLYSELQGYLSQLPIPEKVHDTFDDESAWQIYNETVNQISGITGVDYSRFQLKPIKGQYTRFIRINTFRQIIGGLISKLHGEYFFDEPPPFSGMPSTIITQTQQQSQSVQVQMLLDIQSKIDEKLSQYEEGSNERSFLKKLKGMLSTASDVNELISLCLKVAKDHGLSLAALLKLFG